MYRPIKKLLESDISNAEKVSVKWLLGRIEFLRKNKRIPGALSQESYQDNRLFKPGEVYMFHYDPKYKMELPYYDTFPLVIPIEIYNNSGFLGLNLHYLNPNMRIAFLNKLVTYANTPVGESRMRMKITYEILKEANNLAEFVPCVKRYLSTHIRSQLMRVYPHEWLFSAYVPVEAFKKASKTKVWVDSIDKINEYRKRQ